MGQPHLLPVLSGGLARPHGDGSQAAVTDDRARSSSHFIPRPPPPLAMGGGVNTVSARGDMTITCPLSEAKGNLVPRTSFEKFWEDTVEAKVIRTPCRCRDAKHQRVWTGHGSPDGVGDSSVSEVFNKGEGMGDGNTWDSGPRSAINEPCFLGGLVLHLGNEGLGLLSSQAPSGSNMM